MYANTTTLSAGNCGIDDTTRLVAPPFSLLSLYCLLWLYIGKSIAQTTYYLQQSLYSSRYLTSYFKLYIVPLKMATTSSGAKMNEDENVE